MAGFDAMGALSKRNQEPAAASRPFDAQRDGFVIAEGAAVMVLESAAAMQRAGREPLAELSGYATNCDAHHVTAPAPDAGMATVLLRELLASAGWEPGMVDYYNAHGTSTWLNDRMETRAIYQAFGGSARGLAISATKSCTGHLLGAAGALEAVLCVQALAAQQVPPTLNLLYPDPECDLDYTPGKARSVSLDRVVSASFGFGGHNAALAFSKPF
jgi:3-oxoacyl-[acyl-carrier-protein] synthase II